MATQEQDHADTEETTRTPDAPKARFFQGQALKIRMLAAELSAVFPRDGIPRELIHLADQLERRGAEANDDRPFRVLFEFQRIFARHEADALDKCMHLLPLPTWYFIIEEPE